MKAPTCKGYLLVATQPDETVHGDWMDDWRDLARFCLELAGGGNTVTQTIRAMHIQEMLQEGEPITVKGVTYQVVSEEAPA